jgi:uncharacterized protein YutE (UPF0331/DUF86 family)
MYKVPLSKVKIETKLAIIRESMLALQKLAEECTEAEFVENPEKFAIAEHYLRRALEAVFDIGGHIISRFPYAPGKRPKTLREIARALGEKGIVEKEFANGALAEMAGYRNRMVHFYDEIKPAELYKIITRKLNDLEIFATAAVRAADNPAQFGLSIEE